MNVEEIEARVNESLPVVPHGLRHLIEDAVADDRAFLTLVDSPDAALRRYGLNVAVDLQGEDAARLIRILTRLRALQRGGKIREEFVFEDVFSGYPIGDWAKQTKSSETNTAENTKWDASHREASTFKESNSAATKKFNAQQQGIGLSARAIDAPMISPGDLAELLVRLENPLPGGST